MKNSTQIRRRLMVSTVKKSHAIMLRAWLRMNWLQESPSRVAAGPRPAAARILRTLVAEMASPTP